MNGIFEVLKNLLVRDRSIRRFMTNEAIDDSKRKTRRTSQDIVAQEGIFASQEYRIVVDEDEKRGIYPLSFAVGRLL